MILQISAAAGSGKTYALTRRFLDLLLEADIRAHSAGCALHGRLAGHALQEILAATFTNKAAAEMKDRVLTALKERALAEGAGRPGRAGGPAAARVDHVLRHFGSLNIRTIDSLLFTLVRLSALELDLPPDFTPSFNRDDYFTPIYDGLMEDLAKRGGGSGLDREDSAGPDIEIDPSLFLSADPAILRAHLTQACRALLHHGDFNGFTPKSRLRNICFELTDLMLRGQTLPETDIKALHAALYAMHQKAVAACENLLQLFEKHNLSVNARYTAFLRACASCDAWRPMQPKSTMHGKQHLDDCLNKASKNSAPDAVYQAFAKARAAMEAYAVSLPLFRQSLLLAPLTLLAEELYARMQAQRRENGLLPAPLLPHLAVTALGEGQGVSDALCRFGTRLSHLLLDEFQDTSREQWEAILPLAEECLATGGTLTYVGDVKQAIYGWRGGDARLFDQPLKEPRLTEISKSQDDRLPCNWRSHPAVLALNNAFFSLLGEKAVAEPVLRAMLPNSTPPAFLEQAVREATKQFSQVSQAIPEQKNWSADPRGSLAGVRIYEVEASTVAALAQRVKQRLYTLLHDELLPVWRPGDIAVLVRSGAEGAQVAGWLAEWSLPVVTENSFLLAAHPLVNRLIAFLTYLDYPLDDAALIDFLQADFLSGLEGAPDKEQVNAWVASVTRQYRKRRPPLYTLLRRDMPLFWTTWLEPFQTRAGLMSAYDTLSEALARFRLFEVYPEQAPFMQRLLELAHLAENEGHSSLAAFLAFWRTAADNEKLPLPENMDAIRIMTIHKAKGLEFNVVILPFQHKSVRHTPQVTAARVGGLDILTRALPELPDIYYPTCVTNELERLSLLYVAWTRPIYALHAFLTRPSSRPTPLSAALTELVYLFRQRHGHNFCQWEYLGDADETPEDEDSASSEADNSDLEHEAKTEPKARPEGLPAALPWQPMSWLPRLRIFRSPLEAARFSPRQRGILIHLCLEHLYLDGYDSLDEAVTRAVNQGLRLFPLALAEPDKVADETRTALLWFASLPESALWLRHGLREQSIMDAAGRLHRVDLLVDEAAFKKGGALLAIDYKSGLAPRELREHQDQVLRYMRLLHQATGRQAHGLLLYLDEQRQHVIEAHSEGQS
ncbi:UvrD-helicase domain-containing protein [Desulfovibrio sp. OttesenSCG-928-F20]|nr:UvrD-helicase domain-containing protein [Desulfovibrio sp. OttesenSCG-928-M16]MDL2290892.1 UvrD-helicase domain-containing protein [Desulfovibrio sp. OttesenSCG-928-F20]